jgi:hypothetical protein
MSQKEIALLREQLAKLDEKKFDLEAWKNHTLILLERIYGTNHSRVQMIRNLRYDYSSWNLRDVAGAGKSKDPIRMQASEIMEAILYELEQLGPPDESKINESLLTLLEDELTGKQLKEIEKILHTDSPGKTEKIQAILDKLEKENLTLIIAKVLAS